MEVFNRRQPGGRLRQLHRVRSNNSRDKFLIWAIPVTRVSMVEGLIWYFREIGFCPPGTADTMNKPAATRPDASDKFMTEATPVVWVGVLCRFKGLSRLSLHLWFSPHLFERLLYWLLVGSSEIHRDSVLNWTKQHHLGWANKCSD